MKLQIQDQSLRLRVDESELAALLEGRAQRMVLRRGEVPLLALVIEVGEALCFDSGEEWRLVLPAAELRSYAETLPGREALSLDLGGGVRLDFEVDVRDSVLVRGPRRRHQ